MVEGLPRYAGSYVWTLMASNWAVSVEFVECSSSLSLGRKRF